MALRVKPRKDRGGALWITGTVAGEEFRKRASSDRRATAEEEAKLIEIEIIRRHHLGERRGNRLFSEAVNSYVNATPRSLGTRSRLHRILRALGEVPLSSIDQATVERLCVTVLRPGYSPATVTRNIIMPLRAVVSHAAYLGWCDPPRIKSPRQPGGRTRFLGPDEADRLVAAAAPHIKPLLVFLIGTGARMAEALELEWRDVDLVGAKVTFWRTKNGKRRVVSLPRRVTNGIMGLRRPENGRRVFLTNSGTEYYDSDRQRGGQIRTAWYGALRRAGLDPELTPHDLRHTWATWHYALHKDLLALKEAGGWSSVALVERYAHLMPAGQEEAIRRFLGTVEQRRENAA